MLSASDSIQTNTCEHHTFSYFSSIRNSYTIGCSPVRGDNPRALASGLSYVQVDKYGITIYTTYISVDRAHHEIFRANVGGINSVVIRSIKSDASNL